MRGQTATDCHSKTLQRAAIEVQLRQQGNAKKTISSMRMQTQAMAWHCLQWAQQAKGVALRAWQDNEK